MGMNAGALRETLVAAIEAVRAGTMDPKTADSISKLAAQVTNSLQVEINAIKELRAMGVKLNSTPGHLAIGSVIETPSPAIESPKVLEDDHEEDEPEPVAVVAVAPLELPKESSRVDPDAELRKRAREVSRPSIEAVRSGAPKFVHGTRY